MSAMNDEPATLRKALVRYAFDRESGTPNYQAFKFWFFGRVEGAKTKIVDPLRPNAASAELNELFSDLLREIEAAGLKIAADGLEIAGLNSQRGAGGSRLAARNRAKLLISLWREMPERLRQMLVVLSSGAILDPSESGTPSQERAAFFKAVVDRDARSANKILGRLKANEQDEGEKDYLEALYLYHSGDYKEAKKYASKVSQLAIDGPNAQRLELLCLAQLADIETFEAKISSLSWHELPSFFVIYLLQLALSNAKDPLELHNIILDKVDFTNLLNVPNQGYFRDWNEHCCSLAVEAVERVHNFNLACQARGDHEPSQKELFETKRIQQILTALSLDDHMQQLSLSGDRAAVCEEVVRRLCAFPDRESVLLALRYQARLEQAFYFVANVVRNRVNLAQAKRREEDHVLTLGYQIAIQMGLQSEAELLKSFARSEEALPENVVLPSANMTPMGVLSYRTASRDLQRAEQEDDEWRDAGMVALGFFRILELELNERFLRPALNEELLNSAQRRIKELRDDNTSKSKIKSLEAWERTVKKLEIMLGGGAGMDLGELEIFFGRVRDGTGWDGGLKELFSRALRKKLSREGEEALDRQAFTSLIGQDARERFRNPPAHTRYLSLRAARMAKDHVDEGLRQLARWFTLS